MPPAHNSAEPEQVAISEAPVMEPEAEPEYRPEPEPSMLLESPPPYKPESASDTTVEDLLSGKDQITDIPEAEPEHASNITLEELLPDLPRITEPSPESPEPSPESPEPLPAELSPESILELQLLKEKPKNLKKFLTKFDVTKTHSVDAVVKNICSYYDRHTYGNTIGLDKWAISETIDIFAKFLSLEYFKGQYNADSKEIGGGALYMILLSHPSLKKWRNKIDFKFANFNPETRVLVAGLYDTWREWRYFDLPPDNDSPYSAINLYVNNFQRDLFNSPISAVLREIRIVNHRKSKRDTEYHAINSDESIRRTTSIAKKRRHDVRAIPREKEKRELYIPLGSPIPQRMLSGVTSNHAYSSGVSRDTLGPDGGAYTSGGCHHIKIGPMSDEEYAIALDAYNKAKEANPKIKIITDKESDRMFHTTVKRT